MAWDEHFLKGLQIGSDMAIKKKELEAAKAFREYQMKQGGIDNQLNQDKLTLDRQELATSRNKIMQDAWYKRKMLNQGVPVYTFGADGTPQMVGNVPKGSKVVPPSQMSTPEQKAAQEIATATAKSKIPTADMRNMVSSVDSQLQNMKALRKQTENLKGGYEGMWNRLVGVATRGKEQGDTIMYERKKPAYAAGLYRALTGDTRLSDQDAQTRAYPLLWDTGLDKSLQKPMFDDIENALMARKIMLTSGMGTPDPETGTLVTSLDETTALGKKISKARAAGYSEAEITKYFGGKNGK